MFNNFFRDTLRKLSKMDYIVVIENNTYILKKKDSDEVFAQIPSTENKSNWLKDCYNKLITTQFVQQ